MWTGIRAWGRRLIAYGFKVLAVIGGIAVAAGISKEAAQVVGIAIAVVVAVDGIFSNHVRLLATVEAKNAYDRVLNQVRREHQQKLIPILQLKEAEERNKDPDPKSVTQLLELNSTLLKKLHDECTKVEEAERATDLGALRGISLDHERGGRPAG
jgi:hypothetical protein